MGRGGDGNNSESCLFLLLLRLSKLAGAQHQPEAKAGAGHSTHGLFFPSHHPHCFVGFAAEVMSAVHTCQHWAPDGEMLDRGGDCEVLKSFS